jgi:hypothetical protein
LVVRVGYGNNLVWSALVERIAGCGDRDTLATLLELLEDFYRQRRAREGMRRIFLAYEGWLRRHGWYDKKSPSFVHVPWAKPRKRH